MRGSRLKREPFGDAWTRRRHLPLAEPGAPQIPERACEQFAQLIDRGRGNDRENKNKEIRSRKAAYCECEEMLLL